MASALHCALYARCGALGAQSNGPYGYIREKEWNFGLPGKVVLRLGRKAYRRLCDVGPSGACNSKHQHMSSWSYHSHWCIGGTHERWGVSRQREGTSKGLDHLPVSAGWSSCCRLVQRLEEAPWPIAGPWSPFTDRIRGQLAGSHEPVLAGSRLAGRDPALSLAANYEANATHSIPGRRQVIRVATPSTVARSPHARGWSALLALTPNLGRAVVNPIKQWPSHSAFLPTAASGPHLRRRLDSAEAAVLGPGSQDHSASLGPAGDLLPLACTAATADLHGQRNGPRPLAVRPRPCPYAGS
jgi:hypothetical protein